MKLNKSKLYDSQYASSASDDTNVFCNEFKIAIELFEIQSTKKALHYFQLAYESVNQNDIHHNKYASYCGLVRLHNNDIGGLELCREAARNEKRDADVFLNLARAEWRSHNRKKTVVALENGLSIDNRHRGILNMMKELGVRKNKVVPLLPRNHAINNFLEKLFRKKPGRQFSSY